MGTVFRGSLWRQGVDQVRNAELQAVFAEEEVAYERGSKKTRGV